MDKAKRHKKYKEGGKNGGDKTLERHGRDHYKKIGKAGAEKRWGKNIEDEIEDVEDFDEPENVV